MPSYDLTGIVKLVVDQQTFDSGFTKREFVVTTEGERFPQEIKFECLKDRVSLLDKIEPGQRVKVSFDLRGNEYNERYFVNLTAWRIDPADSQDAAATPADDFAPANDTASVDEVDADGIPF